MTHPAFADDFLPKFQMYFNVLREYIEQADQSQWEYRPAPKCPPLVAVFMEAIQATYAFLNCFEKRKVGASAETLRVQKSPPRSKDVLLAELDMARQMLETAVSSIGEEEFQAECSHPTGWKTTLGNMLWFLRDHYIYYSGQLSIYFRGLGLAEVEFADFIPVLG